MWEKLVPYPQSPVMPKGAAPWGARLVVGKGGVLTAWDSCFHMGVDAGRAEGAGLVFGTETALIFVAVVVYGFYRLVLKALS